MRLAKDARTMHPFWMALGALQLMKYTWSVVALVRQPICAQLAPTNGNTMMASLWKGGDALQSEHRDSLGTSEMMKTFGMFILWNSNRTELLVGGRRNYVPLTLIDQMNVLVSLISILFAFGRDLNFFFQIWLLSALDLLWFVVFKLFQHIAECLFH